MYKFLGLLLIISYFIYHGFTGKRGIVSTLNIDNHIIEKQQILDHLINERELVQTKLKYLKIGSIDYDFLDEVARKQLGLADKNEKIIIITQDE